MVFWLDVLKVGGFGWTKHIPFVEHHHVSWCKRGFGSSFGWVLALCERDSTV